MAIAAPATVLAERAQDITVTVTLSTPTNVAGWTATATLRAYNGGTALATKTIGSGITVTDEANGVFVISFSASDLTQPPGAYVWGMDRTNSGYVFSIVDPSGFIIRPAEGSAYPTLTNLSEFMDSALGGATPSDTGVRQYIQLLAAAEDWVQRYCNRRFTYAASQTFYLDGTGTRTLIIPETPVVSVTSVKVDSNGHYGDGANAFSEDALTAGTDYVLQKDDPDNTGQSKSGILHRIGNLWPYNTERPYGLIGARKVKCPGSVKIVATCGYQLIPYPIKQAVWMLTALLTEMSESGRLVMSESGEGHSVSYGGVDDMPLIVQKILAPFKRIIVV